MQVGDITLFGETNYRNQCRRFGIKTDDRRRHMYLIGKTGMGKSTALENLIYSDIMAGHGMAIVDPHGDLVEKMLDFIPSNRLNDVIYFNPSDTEYPIAFNVIENVDPSHQHLVASGLVGVFKKIYAESWGPRLEYVLRNTILALLDYPGSTLLGTLRLLVDKTFRKKVVEKIKDPVVKAFWVEEYAKYPDKFQTEAIAPIQNKVGQFLSNSLIRNIVGQVKSAIDMRAIMDGEKILLVNLAKGRVGEDTSGLLGAMMITKLQLAAMERIDIPERERKDFYLYVDEFQNFATDSFANILSEARKYRLNLIIAHQYIEQLSDVVRAAVFGNVGTLVCFRVGGVDAEELVKEFTPHFEEEDLVNLPKYNVYLKLMIDGVASEPFSARILPPLTEEMKTGNREKIIKVSRERYAKPKEVIEEKIARWSGVMGGGEGDEDADDGGGRPPMRKGPPPIVVLPKPDVLPVKAASAAIVVAAPAAKVVLPPKEKKMKERKSDTKPKETFQATCHRCSATTELSFKPDGARPVYCKECLKIVRSEDAKKKNTGVKEAVPMVRKEVEEAAPIKLADALKQAPQVFKQKHERKKDVPVQPPAPTSSSSVTKVQPGQTIRFS
ncbi:type IV secretion system DNA-binding domain-containing protein [Candidatus Uhrbacteria bacterium]|nr:type IV secretion system DNA-binding domain-containing protein [Candidatus Uhrbacteria bacterium]